MRSPARLADLLACVPGELWSAPPAPAGDLLIHGLCHDSRRVAPGDLFFAVPGAHTEGLRHVEEALARGAVVAVVPAQAQLNAPEASLLRAVSVRQAMGLLAALFHGEPSARVRVIGVTGTDGKTSTAWLARHLLAAAGRRAVAAGTLGIKGDGDEPQPWAGERAAPPGEAHRAWTPTTPEAIDFQGTLARLRDAGIEDVVTEVSSHALAQDRVFGTQFRVVALLHVSADHLDFHGTRDAYLEAKARLFDPRHRGGPLEREPVRAVIDIDHPFGSDLARAHPAALTFGESPAAAVRLVERAAEAGGQRLVLEIAGARAEVRVPLPGRFHAANLLAAAAIGLAAGLTREQVLAGLASAPAIPGRFEAIDAGQAFTVLVDYAHTADALERLLPAAREGARGRLLLLFGCGGDRDASKRGPMGAVAARLADHVILTTDNPRSEDPAAIAEQVASGLRGGPATWEAIPDRRAALARALELARPGDVVVAAGKGSEAVQIFGDRVEPFDDRRVLRELLSAAQAVPITASPAEPWSLAAVAEMTGATVAGISPEDWRLIGPLVASGAAIDSRALSGGEVFIALAGARQDGHAFIVDAFEAGAAAVLVRRSWWSRRKAARAQGVHLLVDDPLAAMQAWAAGLRRAVGPRVVAVTGSSGKTTTKEMILALLRGRGDVVGTRGNLNNEIGLPWTLLAVRSRTRLAVLEMGANHPGEIGRLARIARPDVAVLTCIGHAHAGLFGGHAGILAAKLELLDELATDGAVVIPDDDEELDDAVRARWAGRILRFGTGDHADVRAESIESSLHGTRLRVAGLERTLELRLLGEGAVRAALAALAVVRALGDVQADVSRLERLAPAPGRMDVRAAEGVTWLLDMYNASPESTLVNLRFFKQTQLPGRKVFVFGGMRELGAESEAQHLRVGAAAGFCDAGVFLGEEARIAAPAAQKAGEKQVLWCSEVREVVQFLRQYLQPGDAVYLKGARAAGLERVAQEMRVIDATYGEGGA